MPLYDYQCQECKHHFEAQRKIAEMEAPCADPCPECGKPAVQKIIASGRYDVIDPVRLGRVKPPQDWRDMLKSWKRKNPGSDFNTF